MADIVNYVSLIIENIGEHGTIRIYLPTVRYTLGYNINLH